MKLYSRYFISLGKVWIQMESNLKAKVWIDIWTSSLSIRLQITIKSLTTSSFIIHQRIVKLQTFNRIKKTLNSSKLGKAIHCYALTTLILITVLSYQASMELWKVNPSYFQSKSVKTQLWITITASQMNKSTSISKMLLLTIGGCNTRWIYQSSNKLQHTDNRTF